jgi:hypothetical protein
MYKSPLKKKHRELGMVTHSCNPSYSEGRQRLGGLQFEASLGKKLVRTPYLNNQARHGGSYL